MLSTVSSVLESEDPTKFGLQDYVNNATNYEIEKKGGLNKLHSTYSLELAKNVVGNQNSVLDKLQPSIKIDDSNIYWNKAYRIVIALLRRYEMEDTLHAMRLEYPNLPKRTGFSKTSDLNREFNQLFDYNDEVTCKLTLADKVRELAKEVNLPHDNDDDDHWEEIQLSTVANDQELTLASTTIENTLDENIHEAQQKLIDEKTPKSPRRKEIKVKKEVEPEKIRIRVRKHDENGETYVHKHHHRPKPKYLSTNITKTVERKLSPGGTPRIVVKRRIVKVVPHFIQHHHQEEEEKKQEKLPKPNTDIEIEPLDLDDFEDNFDEPKTPDKSVIEKFNNSNDNLKSDSSEGSDENVAMTLPGPESPSTIDKLQMFIDGMDKKKSSYTLDESSIFRHRLSKNHTMDGIPAKKYTASKRYKDGSLMKKRINDPLLRLPKNHSIDDSGVGYHRSMNSGDGSARRKSNRLTGTYSSSDYSISNF